MDLICRQERRLARDLEAARVLGPEALAALTQQVCTRLAHLPPVFAHNDLAPWNLILGPERWTFIDWDLVAPGRRMWDLAWALHSFVGLWPESALSHEQTVRRIAAFCDGAEVDPADRPLLLDIVVERTQQHVGMLRDGAQAGDAALARLVEDGHAETWERGSRHVETNRDRWAAGLRE